MRPSPEAVALAKAIPDTSDALWKWSIKMDNSVSLESDPTPVHAAIRILAAECEALEKERDGLLKLCYTARVVMMGDTKHDGGDIESDWIQDFDDLYTEIAAAKGAQE